MEKIVIFLVVCALPVSRITAKLLAASPNQFGSIAHLQEKAFLIEWAENPSATDKCQLCGEVVKNLQAVLNESWPYASVVCLIFASSAECRRHESHQIKIMWESHKIRST